MKYAIIGTGAIGGYYGARLAQSGQKTEFLLHSDYDFVNRHGLTVDSCDGSFILPHVDAFPSTAQMSKADVVIVALKTTNNHLLATLLPPVLKEDTIVVLIQNGIGVEADVQEMFPHVQLVAGLAFICSAKTQPGHVNHQCYGHINLAFYSCSNEAKMEQLVSEFLHAGIRAQLVEYHEARWKKAVWNMPFNGMTVALDTQTDILLKEPATRQLIKQQMMEVVGAAQACGVENIDEAFADNMIEMTLQMPPYSPSMKLDYDFHRPMEIEYLYRRPISEAAKHGFPMPRLSMLEAELSFIDRQQRQNQHKTLRRTLFRKMNNINRNTGTFGLEK